MQIKAAAALAGAVIAVMTLACTASVSNAHLGFVSSLPKYSPDTRFQLATRSRAVARPIATKMSLRETAGKAVKSLTSRISYSAVVLAALAVGFSAPQKASAKTNQFGMSASGEFYEYVPKETSSAPIGAAAGIATLTFGGVCAVAIKKDLEAIEEDAEVLNKEVDRLANYKQEFLDGVPSDRSIYASLTKAMQKDTVAKPAKEEDEFEKNVRAYLEEEEQKNQKKDKKKPDGMGKGPSSALLERPSDPDGSKADAWMNDIVIEDKPAAIAEEDLKRLQRMFGGDLPKL